MLTYQSKKCLLHFDIDQCVSVVRLTRACIVSKIDVVMPDYLIMIIEAILELHFAAEIFTLNFCVL